MTKSRSSSVGVVRVLTTAVAVGVALYATPGCAKPSTQTASPPAPAPAATGGAAAGMLTTRGGIYTAQQATEGEELFSSQCSGCHTAQSIVVTPFKRDWAGKSLWSLFSMIKETMPQDNPKSLTDQQYALSLAYMLRVMRMPAGSTPLPADSNSLSRITIDTTGGEPSLSRTGHETAPPLGVTRPAY